MKKVKTMLLSLVILSIAGAALAFKAKQNERLCTAAWNGVNCQKKCPNLIFSTRTTANGAVYCTTTPALTEEYPGGPLVSTCIIGSVDLDCYTTEMIKPN